MTVEEEIQSSPAKRMEMCLYREHQNLLRNHRRGKVSDEDFTRISKQFWHREDVILYILKKHGVFGKAFSQKGFEEIRKHAKTMHELWLSFSHVLPASIAKDEWVPLDVVLGAVAKEPFVCKGFTEKLQEPFAELAHQIWSEFIDYCLRIGAPNGPEFQRKSIWEKWHSQSQTPYEKLSEKEKESDRFIARRFLALLGAEHETPKTEMKK